MPTRLEEFHEQHKLQFLEFKNNESTRMMHELRLAGLRIKRYSLKIHAASRDLGFLFERLDGMYGCMWVTMATKTIRFHIWIPGACGRTSKSALHTAVAAINNSKITDTMLNDLPMASYVRFADEADQWRQF